MSPCFIHEINRPFSLHMRQHGLRFTQGSARKGNAIVPS